MKLALLSGALVLAVSCASPPSDETTVESREGAMEEDAAIPR
jgi:hypothetical protein